MLREITDRNRPGYRVVRSTVVLARHSTVLANILDKDLSKVLKQVERVNYDFEQLDSDALETLYGYFDDKFMSRVKDEFMFIPHRGAIRDNHDNTAICNLCGKGDSKDTGDNEDHIRYEFLLTNIKGGQDVWCGSTCIINYGLKVQGARTGKQAKRILERTLREHKRAWEIEQWQAEHGDHADIPEQYIEFRRVLYYLRLHGELYDNFGEMQLAGFDVDTIRNTAEDGWRDFRTAARYYQRNNFLTERKMEAWATAKRILQQVAEMRALLKGSEGVIDQEERFDHFVEIKKERKAHEKATAN